MEVHITQHIKILTLIYYSGQEERCSFILLYLSLFDHVYVVSIISCLILKYCSLGSYGDIGLLWFIYE